MSRYDDAAAASGAVPAGGTAPEPALRAHGHLTADVHLRRGDFALQVAITAEPGEIVAVLGPNGAGKSTLLGILAGLLAPDAGRVRVGGRTLTDARMVVPPERRHIGLMGQDPMLFPHLTALENVAFGPRSQGTPRRRARDSAAEWLAQMGLEAFADRRPPRLSGGQRQRVALARALAADPEVLLLDEPLAALDAQTAPEIRQVLRDHLGQAGMTTVLVTHDVLDAATLADRVVVLADGEVVDEGAPAAVLTAPRSEFAAALAGVNLVRGRAGADVVDGAAAAVEPAEQDAPVIHGLAGEAIARGQRIVAVFPPSAVAVYLEPPPTGSPRNLWPARVVAMEAGATAIRLRVDWGRGTIAVDLTPAAVAELGLAPGAAVYLAVKATEVRVYLST